VADTGNSVVVETQAAKPAILFLSDCWYPLIKARVDGRTAPLWRADYAYRAVPVGAGRHEIEFVYEPLDLYAGVAITLIAVIMLLAVWAIRRRRLNRRATDGK
jgi:uncharacterized membrane protein YfhO